MRVRHDALSYAMLSSLWRSHEVRWQADGDVRTLAAKAFEEHVDALCAAARIARDRRTARDASREEAAATRAHDVAYVGDARGLPAQTHSNSVGAGLSSQRNGSDAGERTGARTAELIATRLLAREEACTRRNALDLQRLADLQERMNVRQAQAARRRWFIYGRLLARAAEEEDVWQDILDSLLARTSLSNAEARALGLCRGKNSGARRL